MTQPLAITVDDVADAMRLLAPVAVRTPLIENAALNEQCGRRILIKFEGAQHTGSFKFRGAYNRLARLTADERRAGAVAWSSGNHAQGVAFAARMLGIDATIIMPSDAPKIKLDNTRALGAEIRLYDRACESREEIATALARNRGATLVPSFDDPYIIAGQGTVGLEILEQARAADASIEQILVNCGGGGLIAGIATAVKAAEPDVAIYCAEPATFDDTARSLHSGERESVGEGAQSICDALLSQSPGVLTFPINRALLAGGFAVTDDEVKRAMRYAFTTLKLVTEPGGAVALAALLSDHAPACDSATVVVISGANVDPALFAAILGERA